MQAAPVKSESITQQFADKVCEVLFRAAEQSSKAKCSKSTRSKPLIADFSVMDFLSAYETCEETGNVAQAAAH